MHTVHKFSYYKNFDLKMQNEINSIGTVRKSVKCVHAVRQSYFTELNGTEGNFYVTLPQLNMFSVIKNEVSHMAPSRACNSL